MPMWIPNRPHGTAPPGLRIPSKVKSAFLLFLLAGLLFTACAGCAAKRPLGGPVQGERLKDGFYKGEATSGPVGVMVEVRIQDRRITSIRLMEHRHWRGEAAEKLIAARIIEEQSTRVDAVSGATTSSIAIMNAVENAVQKAR
jgi:major membrane immunogen (membrane-anchored lipoprotein)